MNRPEVERAAALKWPAIAAVAEYLRGVNARVDGDCDVRLQVYDDGGTWAVRYGSSDYDQDHRGYWGASSVPGRGKRFDSKGIARDLIEQCKEAKALDDSAKEAL